MERVKFFWKIIKVWWCGVSFFPIYTFMVNSTIQARMSENL